MSLQRIAITIPDETLKRARRVSGRTQSSLSAYISRAVAHEVQADDDFDAMLAEMRAEHGEMSASERRAAEQALHGKKKRSR